MKAGAEAGRRRREAAEAAATPEERVVMYAARKEKMRELKKQEVRASRLAGVCAGASVVARAIRCPSATQSVGALPPSVRSCRCMLRSPSGKDPLEAAAQHVSSQRHGCSSAWRK